MKRSYFGISLLALLAFAGTANAKTWTIMFTNFFYSDSSLTVNVGDTMVWSGDFGSHPLTLVTSPPGAATFSHVLNGNSGANFQYIVTATGTYHYHCDNHFTPPLNMTGSFTAVASGVAIPLQSAMSMQPVYPNPAQSMAMVDFTLASPAHVTLRIYDAAGTLTQTPTDENMDAGPHMLMIDTKQLASGSYQYVLQAGDAVLQRSAIVVK